MFSYMKVHCPICKAEMDGMKGYGREARCCGKECYEEWEWRKTLAIMNRPYQPKTRTPKRSFQAEGEGV
jgi:hypothetical protein